MTDILQKIRWRFFVRPKIQRAYEQGGAINAAVALEVYGYKRGVEFAMIRALVEKHKWKLNGGRGRFALVLDKFK